MSSEKKNPGLIQFTPREAEFLAAAFQSMKGVSGKGPEIDYGKMAVILGMTKGSVSNVMGPLKKRIFAGESAPATPRKTPGGRGRTNGTPASGRSSTKAKAIMAGLDNPFGNTSDADADGSPTPTPSRRMNTSSPLKRKMAELSSDNEPEEDAGIAVRAPRQKRQASLFTSRIKKEQVDNDDDEDASSSSAVTDSVADPEYEDHDLA